MKKNNVAISNFNDLMQLSEQIPFTRDPDDFFEWLTKTDFFIAPASTQHHESYPGGLYDHCKKVYTVLLHLNSISKQQYSLQTIFYMAFGHDLSKVDCYKVVQRNRKVNNVWESYDTYEYVENLPYPHGMKSVVLLEKYIALTDCERLAITYHMGYYHIAKEYMIQKAYYAALESYPLVALLHAADALAVNII